MCRALGETAWRTLEAFASTGGHLVADVLPGTHDALGAPRSVESTALLFGVAVAPSAPDSPPAVAVQESAGILESMALDSTVQAREAVAFGGDDSTPAWLAHLSGGSARLLLNHPLPAFGGAGDAAQEGSVGE